MPDFAFQDAAAGALTLHYAVRGNSNGPPLLLLGGTGWDLRQRPSALERGLQQQFQVLRHDQRGQGQSSKPDLAYDMADYAHDAAQLLAALGWQQTAVIGISFGGMVAQHLALDYPHLVSRLALCCTSSGGAGGASYPLHELQHLSPPDYAARFLLLANRKRDALWQQAHPQLYNALLTELANSRAALNDADNIGLQRQLQARRLHDCWQRLPQLRMPVLVCGGNDDAICPPDNVTALAAQIPGADLQMFAGGHGFYLEDGKALPILAQFLAG